MKHVVIAIMCLALFNLLFPQNAYAYIDPGSASYVFQVILAAFIGALFFLKLFWRKIKAIFIKPRDKEKDETEG